MSAIIALIARIASYAAHHNMPQLLRDAEKIVEDAIHGPGGVGKVHQVVTDLEKLLADSTTGTGA